MFQRLFGETIEEQIKYLQWRVIVTIVSIAACALGFLAFQSNWTPIIAIVMLFVWGWNVVRTWFGFTTVASILTGNVVFGVIIFLAYVIIAYLIGVVFAFLGIGRYIYLKIAQSRQEV